MFNFYFIWFFFVFVLSILACYFSFVFGYYDYFLMVEYYFFSLNSISIYYVIVLDWISLTFLFVVLFISSMVILYSYNYMGIGSYSSLRFLFLVVLFILSMILMIISPSLISILLGWDGLGLVSYCLVIYYSSMSSYLAGMITCLTNRLGDIGLLISISWIFSYGSWHFIFYNSIYDSSIFYMIIVCSFTSSAQIPFSSWLPAAMAAPTPVSSLVHSSTLVTAGVYLLIRFYTFIHFSFFFFFLSLVTLLFSSFCANYEFDLKSIIAFSTLSQLGLMMCSLLFGFKDLAFFHLISHAMFKSLLFLCAGIFIYYLNDNQDIRYMGSLCMSMPITCSCFNISSMVLCGIPFLSGFYSKDLIIELTIFSSLNFIFFIFYYLSLGLTVTYSVRLFYYTMIKSNCLSCYSSFFDSYSLMKLSIIFLSLMSIVFGCSIMWLMNFDFMFIIFPFYVSMLTVMSVFMGFWLGLEIFGFKNFMFFSYYFFNGNMWFLSGYLFFAYSFLYNYMSCYLSVLNCWGEYYGGFGLGFYLKYFSNFIYRFFSSNMKVFFLSFMIWFMFFI